MRIARGIVVVTGRLVGLVGLAGALGACRNVLPLHDHDAGPGLTDAGPAQVEFLVDNVAVDAVTLTAAVGATAQANVALHNVGGFDVTILTDPPLLLEGADDAQFDVVTQPAVSVPVGAQVPFVLSYHPSVAGAHEASVLFAWGAPDDERISLPLHGTAQ
jgi:hypothetical protein